ncbi:carbon storage regulator CsrA [Pseudomonas yamanorum]|jgi:carbon storage regulator|uniref:Translational regulator CsrA n=1 Tax=Pseudomonas yamanorum TaxID=515393 RepID=A0A143GKN6_9PSED|nr:MULTISPECIES: carbon storage regulator CsrA [Pseudomonas]AMW84815.1 Carbon storage regulator [Pseudomonas yamanorum]MBK5411872.1 carbon storage regulator CsrA [Pseudomonas sp. TH34]MBV6663401.1 carbon storage regulator CsrA [Pseudomonas yamanorum]MDR0191298.1 carbon storage regulator CsrA [Pseudomonas yamanorum]NVZ88661.1 carbon storage regulator CsrA [Pseudomonas yamanorum]
MLVLSRAVGEIISVGDQITLRILEVNGTQVKLGVEAPVGVNVHRAEVYQKILSRQGQQTNTHPVPVPNP